MNKRQKLYKKQRLQLFIALSVIAIIAFSLIIYALNSNLYYFHSPEDVALDNVNHNRPVRLGGLVKKGSIVKDGITVNFIITDGIYNVNTLYRGVLPSLFREGQGVVVTGKMNRDSGYFLAKEVLAKHDENYMPKEVTEHLKKQGTWKGDSQ